MAWYDTDKYDFHELAKSDDDRDREFAAKMSPDLNLVTSLANDPDDSVRFAVVDRLLRNLDLDLRPRVPVDITIDDFVDDPYWAIRMRVAKWTHNIDVIAKLAKDPDADVRKKARASYLYDEVQRRQAAGKKLQPKRWPSAKDISELDSDESIETFWDTWLSSPEEQVNNKLKVYCEPSTQGGVGDMVVFNEADEDTEPEYIDFDTWTDNELDMAASSKNATEYKRKYEAFLREWCSWL